ncbi:hypothetical protein BC826DRAFT_47585 [Russula brevipes]|nr:hypothetical protein BC826DRAFT_47585 [Russula brevipes]
MAIHMLPNDVLLEIFNLFVRDDEPKPEYDVKNADDWHTLVHVCQRWRNLVFASPRRLNLRLLCTGRRSVTAMLDIWPTLPIILSDPAEPTEQNPVYEDNIIAALEHPDRVCHIDFCSPQSLSERITAAMKVPFPELTCLALDSEPPLPGSLFGQSAPRLRTLRLSSVAFPAALSLLLSARDLVDLEFNHVPDSWCYPLDKMIPRLSELPRLKSFRLAFTFHPRSQSSPPPTRKVFPALTRLSLRGSDEYVENVIARIDTPLLKDLDITFIDPIPDTDIPQLYQFICRTEAFEPHHELRLMFSADFVGLWSRQKFGPTLYVDCMGLNSQVLSMARMCSWLSPVFHRVDRLDLMEDPCLGPVVSHGLFAPFVCHALFGPFASLVDGEESMQFSAIFRSFPAIRRLHVAQRFVEPVLQELTGTKATEVLPELRDLFLEGIQSSPSVQEVIQPFIAARQLSGHPVAVHDLGFKD